MIDPCVIETQAAAAKGDVRIAEPDSSQRTIAPRSAEVLCSTVNIGVTVATGAAYTVPTVFDCDTTSLDALSREAAQTALFLTRIKTHLEEATA